jgi:hypothetical protein
MRPIRVREFVARRAASVSAKAFGSTGAIVHSAGPFCLAARSRDDRLSLDSCPRGLDIATLLKVHDIRDSPQSRDPRAVPEIRKRAGLTPDLGDPSVVPWFPIEAVVDRRLLGCWRLNHQRPGTAHGRDRLAVVDRSPLVRRGAIPGTDQTGLTVLLRCPASDTHLKPMGRWAQTSPEEWGSSALKVKRAAGRILTSRRPPRRAKA